MLTDDQREHMVAWLRHLIDVVERHEVVEFEIEVEHETVDVGFGWPPIDPRTGRDIHQVKILVDMDRPREQAAEAQGVR